MPPAASRESDYRPDEPPAAASHNRNAADNKHRTNPVEQYEGCYVFRGDLADRGAVAGDKD